VEHTIMDLGTLGGTASEASEVNMSSVVVVTSTTEAGETHAFRWDPRSGLQDLGTLGGEQSVASDINNRGQIAGWSQTATGATHAFIWSKARGMRDLGTLSLGESGPAITCGYCMDCRPMEPFR
jgi:probable HAF family extracellular repeat protein